MTLELHLFVQHGIMLQDCSSAPGLCLDSPVEGIEPDTVFGSWVTIQKLKVDFFKVPFVIPSVLI